MVAPLVPPQTKQAQSTPVPTEQGELLTETIPPVPMPKVVSAAPPMTSTIPPIAPTTFEPFITISASKFRGIVHTLQTLTTTHTALFQQMAAMRSQQDQQMAILRQIQQHLGLLLPPQPDLPESSKPLGPTKDTIPPEDTTTTEVHIPPPQEATTDAIASDDPQDEPQIVDTVTATPKDTSSPPRAGIT